jgi:hypothetical protein
MVKQHYFSQQIDLQQKSSTIPTNFANYYHNNHMFLANGKNG